MALAAHYCRTASKGMSGGGVEIREVAVAPVGEYRVLYNFYSNEQGGRIGDEPAVRAVYVIARVAARSTRGA